uniref:SUN domain-containing protein n=1 Tax=Caenorhabditis tropicalis TaxID=1561998 RepID=A0A1I7UD92_9PELO
MTLKKADIESAHRSEISSFPIQTVKRETFSIQEPTGRIDKWNQYRQYGLMFVIGVFGLILILLLINSYRISSDVEEIRSIKENEKVMEHLSKALKEVKPIFINEEDRNEENEKEEIPIKNSLHIINSASYMFGASVDTSYSSSSDLSGESDLVLLDRPNPPANRAWCSDENEPVLTVNLANYIKPTAVSYQHFKWNETVPHGSPRVFDVFSCLDFHCEKTEPLISNCEYISFGEIQEQIYRIPLDSRTKSIGKVQFRFLKNHGNVKKTCVSLVRVYGESTDLPKMRKYKENVGYRGNTSPAGKTCSELREMFHNSPFSYDKFEFKTCEHLFSNSCCSVCPECCDECYIDDYTTKYEVGLGILGGLAFIFGLILMFFFCFYICTRSERNDSRQNGRRQTRR